jgi:hypothetical protein
MEPVWWNRLASLSNELIRNNTLFILEGQSQTKALKNCLSGVTLDSREKSQQIQLKDITNE